MGLKFRKKLRITKNISAYLSASNGKCGVSLSARLGRLTINSNGNKTIRLGKGFSYTFKNKKK